MLNLKISNSRKRLVVSALAVCLLTGHALKSYATDITGITGNNGIYNIDPSVVHGDTGFRQYENFKLSEGDIANLIFKYGEQNVSKFVNLVDNTININGLVNTMRDGNFFNGQAIFISPNGMVVGASGVLNVGSLSVYTPTTSDYENFKNNPTLGYYKMDQGNADVVINGKVIARDGIELSGRNVNIGTDGALLSGINSVELLSSKAQADKLFNELVNTSSKSNASSFASKDGKIVIKSVNEEGSVKVDGLVKNDSDGNINITNEGKGGLSIGGKVDAKGNALIVNNKGDLNIGGSVKGAERINITNHGNALNINGTIQNDKVLKVWNTGAGGTNLNGKIVNNANAVIQNDKGAFNIGGDVQNNSSLSIISNGSGMNVNSNAKITNTGSLKMWNKGADGIKIAGTIDNKSKAVVQNYNGNMVISGNLNNSDTLNVINNGNSLSFTESSKVTNSGYTGIQNTGAADLKFNGTLQNNKGNTILTNQKGDMVIGGTLNNVKGAKVNVTNHGDTLNFAKDSVINNKGSFKIWATGKNGTIVAGNVNSSGDMVIQNDNGSMTVSGKVVNNDGTLRLSNKGTGLTFTKESSVNNSGSLTVTNTGVNGTQMNGTVVNDGTVLVSNTKGNITVGGKVTNNGKLSYTSKEGINVSETGVIENNKTLTMLNTGSQGMNIAGKVVNKGSAILTNKGGNYKISGTVDNQSGKVNIVNQSGKMYITESGKLNNNGSLSVWNTGKDGSDIQGTISNTKNGTVLVKNDAGKLNFTGKLNNDGGKVTVQNNGTSMEFSKTSNIKNTGNLSLVNNANGGFRFDGVLDSQGSSYFTNNEGELNINGTINGTDNKLYISSQDGLVIDKDAQIKNQGSLSVLNNGESGLTVNGVLSNNGRTLITSNKGDIIVNGTIKNSGDQINITNHGNGIYVNEQGKVQSDGVLKIWSTGDGGVHIAGSVDNTSSNSAIQNDNGSMNISGSVTNNGDKLYITNHGKDLTITDTANVQSKGNVAIWNTADKKADIKGKVHSQEGKVIITNQK